MKDIKETFCLKNEFDNFSIFPEKHASLYFGRKELQKQIKNYVDKTIVINKPIKMVLIGDYGIGKTHTMYHIKYTLEKTSSPTYNVFLQMGEIKRKTGFRYLFRRMMTTLGLDTIKQVFERAENKYKAKELKEKISEWCSNNDAIATTLFNLFVLGSNNLNLWRWLVGDQLTNQELKSLNLDSNLYDVTDFINVLKSIGRVFWEVDRKKLLFLIDEAETLSQCKDDDALSSWQQGFRLLFDQDNEYTGIIFAIGVRSFEDEDMPEPFHYSAVESRIPPAGRIILDAFTENSVREFITDLLDYLIDKNCVEKRFGKEISSYPFDTDDTLNEFVSVVSSDPIYAKPRIILQVLNDAAAEACLEEKQFIDKESLNDALNNLQTL